jgi:hypothetical protein
MLNSTFVKFLVLIPLVCALAGCANAPGTRAQQGAVIGGAAGAAAGAAVAKGNRGLGAVIGGLLGAGGGYVIAAKTDKINSGDPQAAATAARKAQENPATPADAQRAMNADLNLDGFVTMDEVVAMKQAGFGDDEIVRRLQATDQVFELTADQQQYLLDHGLSRMVVNQMQTMNRGAGASAAPGRTDVLGQPNAR